MAIEQEPLQGGLDFNEMQATIRGNTDLADDTFALLRMQRRLGNLISPELETELQKWAEFDHDIQRLGDQMELTRIFTERGVTVGQRVKNGVDTTPDITQYYERSQIDTNRLREIFARHLPDSLE